MSKSITFYQVEAVAQKLPEVIDIDEVQVDFDYTEEKRAEAWMKKIGQRCLIRYQTVDVIDACEKILGEKPVSVSYLPSGYKKCKDKDGNCIGTVTSEMLQPYRYTEERWVYAYKREEISEIDSYYGPALTNGLVTFDDLVDVVRTYLEHEEDYCVINGDIVVAIMKAAFAAKDGAMVYCDVS